MHHKRQVPGLARGAVGLLFAAAALTAQPRPPSYDFFDTRITDHTQPRTAPRAAAQALTAGPAGAGDPETIARVFLEDHRRLLGIESTAVFSLPLERRYESEAAGLTHLVFRRLHAGIGVFGGDVVAHVTREGKVLEVQPGAVWPEGVGSPSVAAALSATEALLAAARILVPGPPPDVRTVATEGGADRKTVLAVREFRDLSPARLVWFPRSADAVLAWEIFLHIDSRRWYCVVVDAASGELLFSHNLYREDRPRGSVFRAAEVAHPNAGSPNIETFTGWPPAGGDCPAAIYPPQYRSGSLLNRCWVSGAETAGNNAVACLDASGANQCDWRAFQPQAHFDFPFTNSYASSGDALTDRQAAVTNLFYWTNALHDWLYGLGFNEAAGNFQADNFGRGGFGGDAVLADAQDGAGLNNANFATPPDGSAPRMQVFLFPNNGTFLRRDGAFDGDLITHEYIHGLTLRLVGGPGNINVLPLWQSGAMGEGFSDAYAASFTNDPVVGEYISATPATGIRSVAYNNSPYTFGQFGTLYRRNIGALGLIIDLPQVHRDGEIWATVLWDLRVALGETVFEQLLTTALKLTPPRPSMLDGRNAILQAAQAMGVGGAGQCAVWSVFAARGFGASAALNHVQAGQANDTALSVYEAFDRPAACGGSPPQAGATVFLDDMESGANGWTATGLWHQTSRRAAGGTKAWWYGQAVAGNYATGARTSGALTSPPISLAGVGRAILEWDQLFKGEGFGRNYSLGVAGNDPYLNYDTGWVQVSRDGGTTWETLTTLAHNSDGAAFDAHKIDISRYAGLTIRIRFLFDTLDANSNQGEGWYIDNVRVRRLLTGTPALSVTPASLNFSATLGGGASAQFLTVSNLDQGVLNWTATASSSGWLAVTPGSGAGNAVLTVTAQPAGLGAGSYNGTVTVAAAGATGSPVTIAVTLTVLSPVAEWRFEEAGAGPGVSILDSSGNAHHGTTAGYGAVAVPGVVGNARLFNGITDSVAGPASIALSPPSFTFRVWVKLLSYPTAAGWGVVASNYGGNYQGWYVGVTASGRVILSVAGLPSSAPWLVSGTTLALERWYLVTTTYDGATREGVIYINGAADVQAAFPAFTPQSALPFTLARASWFNGYYLNAAIDEARLYGVRQTAAEVLADYQSFAAPPPPPAGLGIVADWKMDNTGSTLTDSSGNSRHGTLVGAGQTTGVRNGARSFNGAGEHARAPASEAYGPASFTVRAWVKLLSYPEAAGWGVAVTSYGGNYQGWYVGVHASGRVILSVASVPSSSPWLLSAVSLALDRWYYVAVTYNGMTRVATIYINGVADAQAGVAGFTPSPSSPVYFGRASWYDGYYLNAALDEVRIDSTAKAPAEILGDYQSFPAPPLPPAPAPVAEWRMDDAGATLADSSGNGHHAASQGGASVAGIRNAARQFNGSTEWAQAPASAALSPSSFTVRAWVKIAALPAGWGVLLANYGGNYQGWYLGVSATGRLIFSVCTLPSSSPWLVSNSALAPGAWHHVTVTYDGSTRAGAIYINGTRDVDAVFPGFTAQAAVPFHFARASWYDGYYLNAAIDEVRLLGIRQSAAEVLADYQSFP